MAWKHTRIRNKGTLATETVTLPATTAETYSSVIDWINHNHKTNTNRVTLVADCSAVSVDNIDFQLYGSDTAAGTVKYLLLNAPIAQITDGTATAGVVDLNAYPAPYYFIEYVAGGDESANTMKLQVFY